MNFGKNCTMSPEVVFVVKGNERTCVFDAQMAHVLERVGNGKGLYPSFDAEGMSRSCGHKKFRALEKALGVKLTSGRSGSGSTLTKEGEDLLSRWKTAQGKVVEAALR